VRPVPAYILLLSVASYHPASWVHHQLWVQIQILVLLLVLA